MEIWHGHACGCEARGTAPRNFFSYRPSTAETRGSNCELATEELGIAIPCALILLHLNRSDSHGAYGDANKAMIYCKRATRTDISIDRINGGLWS